MNKYLLLRDNKQTGPHSLDEMLALGFKKYDLVWVDGKSAAWRYPGELEEFKAIAPLVEEQPFDRFFKKPTYIKKVVDENHASIHEAKKTVEEDHGSVQEARKTGEENHSAQEVPAELKQEPAIKLVPAPKEEVVAIKEAPSVVEHGAPLTGSYEGHKKYQPREMNRKEPDPQQKPSRAQHKYVAVTLPAGLKTKTTEPDPLPEKLYQVKLQSPRIEPPVENPVFKEPLLTATHTSPPQKTKVWLQYSGVAVALISLLVVGILIGMGVNNQPRVEPIYVPSEPARITELKEKLALQQDPPVLSIPVVNQQYQPQQQQASSEVYADAKSVSYQTQLKAPVTNSPTTLSNSETQEVRPSPPAPINDGEKRMAVKRTDTEPTYSELRSDLSKQVDLTTNQYKVGVFGGIENIQVTLKNGSEKKLNEAVVEVRYILSNRKHLTETLRFENIDPGASVTLAAPNSERGIRLETKILKLVD